MNVSPRCNDMNLRHIKTVSLVSPDNVVYEFIGTIRDISHELVYTHGVKSEEYAYHGIQRVLSKKAMHFIGWRLLENMGYDWTAPVKRNYMHKFWDVKLVAPDGTVYGPIENLERFCREHGVTRSSDLISVINGNTKYNNGWFLEGSKPPVKNSRTYDVIIADGSGIQYGPIQNLTEFARIHSVSASALRQFIVGTRPKYKNWEIIKPLENNDE